MNTSAKRFKSSLGIHIGFWLYLTGGSAIYFLLEKPMRSAQVPSQMKINSTFCELLIAMVYAKIQSTAEVTLRSDVLRGVEDACYNLTGVKANPSSESSDEDVSLEFSSALFFFMTVLTTIGYGNFSPRTNGGKFFCIRYGFFGIPLCGLLLANTSDHVGSILLGTYERRYKENHEWTGILVAATTFLIPGLALFLFISAALIAWIEGWTYLDAIYFAFVTLTTVGLGDIVAAQQSDRYSLLWLYRLSWIIWIFVGIAYWGIIMNFVTKAFKSKKLKESLKLISQHTRHFKTPSNAFVASKTKVAMSFALQMAGYLGTIEPEIQPSLASLLGIATTVRPTDDPDRGLQGIMKVASVLSEEFLPMAHGECELHITNIRRDKNTHERIGNTSFGSSTDSVLVSRKPSCPISTAEIKEIATLSDSTSHTQPSVIKTIRCLSLPTKLSLKNR